MADIYHQNRAHLRIVITVLNHEIVVMQGKVVSCRAYLCIAQAFGHGYFLKGVAKLIGFKFARIVCSLPGTFCFVVAVACFFKFAKNLL